MSTFEESENHSALNYSLDSKEKLSSISEVFLTPFGLTTFGYKRVYDDGHYMFLSTNEQWTQYHYQNIHDHGTFFQTAMNNTCTQDFYRVVWPANTNDHFLQSLNHFGMWHGINFYKKGQGYLELWTFSTSVDKENIHQNYINTLKYFEEFIAYFNNRAQEIINVKDSSRLAKFKDTVNFGTNDILLNNSTTYQFLNICDKMKIDKLIIKGLTESVSLTKRETDCGKLLSAGRGTKEIANALDLSPRTVEFYINSIKEKTGLHSRAQIRDAIQSAVKAF